MRLPRPINTSLLLLPLFFAAQAARAQIVPADDFFNSGAQFYISNNIPDALEKTESGLKLYPDDEKLKKLEKLLKQQQQQNQQKQNQEQKQNQSQSQKSENQKNSQSKQQQQSAQQNSQAQKNQEAQKQNPAQQKKDEQQKQAEQKAAAEKAKGENEKENAEGQPVQPGQMTPEEAKRLLDAQKGDEQVLHLQPKGKPENPNQPVKDW